MANIKETITLWIIDSEASLQAAMIVSGYNLEFTSKTPPENDASLPAPTLENEIERHRGLDAILNYFQDGIRELELEEIERRIMLEACDGNRFPEGNPLYWPSWSSRRARQTILV